MFESRLRKRETGRLTEICLRLKFATWSSENKGKEMVGAWNNQTTVMLYYEWVAPLIRGDLRSGWA